MFINNVRVHNRLTQPNAKPIFSIANTLENLVLVFYQVQILNPKVFITGHCHGSNTVRLSNTLDKISTEN